METAEQSAIWGATQVVAPGTELRWCWARIGRSETRSGRSVVAQRPRCKASGGDVAADAEQRDRTWCRRGAGGGPRMLSGLARRVRRSCTDGSRCRGGGRRWPASGQIRRGARAWMRQQRTKSDPAGSGRWWRRGASASSRG